MLRSSRVADTVLLLARLAVGLTFLIAAVDKIQAPGLFADAVRAFHILPGALVVPYALVIPWIELVAAVYLLTGFMSRLGAAGVILLLLSFIYAIGKSLATGDTNHACGCFSTTGPMHALVAWLAGGSTITPWDLIRDLILLALSALVLLGGAGAWSVDGLLSRRRERQTIPQPSGLFDPHA